VFHIVGHGGQELTAPPGVSSPRAEGDPRSLANAIKAPINDDALYRRLGEGSMAWAEDFRGTGCYQGMRPPGGSLGGDS